MRGIHVSVIARKLMHYMMRLLGIVCLYDLNLGDVTMLPGIGKINGINYYPGMSMLE